MKEVQNAKKLPIFIKIVGLILSESYQKCKLFVEKLRKHYKEKFVEPVITGLLDMDWVDYLNKLRKEVGGQTWAVRAGVVVFLDDIFLGGEVELFRRFSVHQLELPTQEKIKSLAKEEYLNYMKRHNRLYTFFELSLDGEYMGSLLFELRPDLLPKTSVWFAMICDPHNHLGYSYKNSTIHRVCQRGWFQGGKLGLGHSAGFLEDESFCYKHDRRGVLSMANYGKDSNRAQFFVTFKPAAWMDEYYVAFGRVVEGSDVLRRLEYTKCTYEHPDHKINIDNCGLVGVGFGRNLVLKKKLKGLTVGVPHVHLDMFVDLIMDRFDEILFERLDEEVKRNFKGEWMKQMLWNAIKPTLKTREPVEDVLDVNDRSSKVLNSAVFIKGLYGLKEIPDHFIMGLLDEIINDCVEVVDTRDMVSSIVNLIVDKLHLNRESRDSVDVDNIVKSVDNIVYGHRDSNSSRRERFQRSLYEVASQTPTIRKLLTEYSTYSMSQASYYTVDEGRDLRPRELFQRGVQKVASSSPSRKLLATSVSQSSVLEGVVEEKRAATLQQRSVASIESHTSTVRKLSSHTADDFAMRESTRESVVGYVWETLFKALNV